MKKKGREQKRKRKRKKKKEKKNIYYLTKSICNSTK